MSNCAFKFAFQTKRNTVYLSQVKKKEGQSMREKERISALEAENQRLKNDNDMLLEIVAVYILVTAQRPDSHGGHL